jgi:hypothetical protein
MYIYIYKEIERHIFDLNINTISKLGHEHTFSTLLCTLSLPWCTCYFRHGCVRKWVMQTKKHNLYVPY